VDGCRQAVVDLLRESGMSDGGESVDDVALMPSTSDGIAAVLEAFSHELTPGATIAVSPLCFGSIVVALTPFRDRGIRIVEVGNGDGEVLPEHLEGLHPPGLVLVDLVNHVTGRRNHLAALSEVCAARDLPIVVDAVQALGAVRGGFSVTQVDALACGGHKWLRGPEGTGFLYVNPRWMPRLRSARRGYRSLANPSRFDVDFESVVLSDRARQLEVGTLNAIGLMGFSAALRELAAFGVADAAAAIQGNAGKILEMLSRIPGVKIATPMDPESRAGIAAFRHHSIPSQDLANRLRHLHVICGVRHGLVRLSPSFDVDGEALCERLREAFENV
jgi:selenocysteine lyase/cysteine desulfurase